MSILYIPLPCSWSGRTLTLKGILRWSVVRGWTRATGADHGPRLPRLQTAGPSLLLKLHWSWVGPCHQNLILLLWWWIPQPRFCLLLHFLCAWGVMCCQNWMLLWWWILHPPGLITKKKNYTIVLSSGCSIFHNFCNGLFSCWFFRQGVLCHWCIFCDEGTAPKIIPHIFVASSKIGVCWVPRMASNFLSYVFGTIELKY